jgi:hypothetical protein
MEPKNSNYPPLFQADFRDWKNNACLHSSASDPTYAYVEGYKRAADVLVSHVMNAGRDQDFLVYPIVFLYRQHLELRFKEIISDGSKLFPDDETLKVKRIHSLVELWPIAKKVIQKVWSEESDCSDYEKINHFIEEITKVDGNSTTFRYPKTKDGINTLRDLQHINLRHLAECIHAIYGFLDGASCGLGFYLDQKDEILE